MNQMTTYLYPTEDVFNRPEHWEICICRDEGNRYLAMAQKSGTNEIYGWQELNVDSEIRAFEEMAYRINTNQQQVPQQPVYVGQTPT
ncbi:hypothetical protein [Effusibacillus consociatus]|uniref:Uncharacterized protein n=1 Tax=Effusibacillus consociatus TaxID=1117041 RepID=A0ABV9PZ51_9BACL